MIYKTRGIVLHHIKYAETSVIATIYTEKFGRQSYMIHGVRAKKSKIRASILQPLFLVNLEVYHKANRDLQRVKELQNAVVFNHLPYDLKKSTLALFIAEILYQTLREQEPHPELFRYLYHSIEMLDMKDRGLSNFHLYFLIHLTKYLGFFPNNNYSEKNLYFDLMKGVFTPLKPVHSNALNELESAIFSRLLVFSEHQHADLKMDYALRMTMIEKILKYFKLHHEGISTVNSYPVLREVFH
ncbi:MAG: DNA repair protein RecO [Bacteroidales bacterium]|jgi:DNA repair protein RecO (recombination protein O)|nr:DNA repair protein RecO [Bacteroidales bacterium]